MWRIIRGDCLTTLDELGDETCRCCITSPPYWQLRDYNTEDQLGCEDTPEQFLEALVSIFRKVRRVLTEDGTLWPNLGDSYCGGGGYWPTAPSNLAKSKQSRNKGSKPASRPIPHGYKQKDLVGIPWQVALALRKDGWFLRSDIIWNKPDGMPEAVTDRPTRTHEYVFLISKSAHYYYNHEAMREDGKNGTRRNRRCVWDISKKKSADVKDHFAVFPEKLVETCLLASTEEGDYVLDPFSGSGTTGIVSLRHRRRYVGLEINEAYATQSEERIKKSLGEDVSPKDSEYKFCTTQTPSGESST